MKRITVLLGACLALAAGLAGAQDKDAADALENAMRGTAIPAMAVLEMRDGHVAREAVRGVRRNDGDDPARGDDVWLIGSDAKGAAMALDVAETLIDNGHFDQARPLLEAARDLAQSNGLPWTARRAPELLDRLG